MKKVYPERSRRGFTLIELLVVIAIIGILAVVVTVNLSSARSKARDARRKSDISTIQTALVMYNDQNSTYIIPGTGFCGDTTIPATCVGSGWVNPGGASGTNSYAKSIAKGLSDAGFLNSSSMPDPSGDYFTSDGRGYMFYLINVLTSAIGPTLYSYLENTTDTDYKTLPSAVGSVTSMHYLVSWK